MLGRFGACDPPSPYTDIPEIEEIANWRDDFFCGFENEDSLFRWFEPELLEFLLENSFRLYEYTSWSKDVLFGEWQVLFKKNNHLARIRVM